MTLEVKYLRFAFHSDIAGDLGWELSDREELVCRFVAPGHQRVFRKAAIEAEIAEAYALAQALAEPARGEALQILADAYWTISFRSNDRNRFHVRREIVLALAGPAPDSSVPIYLQASVISGGLDVLSHEARMARLTEWGKTGLPS